MNPFPTIQVIVCLLLIGAFTAGCLFYAGVQDERRRESLRNQPEK